MNISFLIPLAIALVAVYIRSHIQEEIARILAILTVGISLCWSFAIAPWIVQILVLTVGVLGVWHCCRQPASNTKISTKL